MPWAKIKNANEYNKEQSSIHLRALKSSCPGLLKARECPHMHKAKDVTVVWALSDSLNKIL